VKQIPKKKQDYLNRKNNNAFKREKLEAGFRKLKAYKKKYNKRYKEVRVTYIDILKRARTKLRTKFYKKLKYDKAPIEIEINGKLGLESDFNGFIKVSSLFVDTQSRWIDFNFDKCSRVWPSAITLLCSFKQWTEITSVSGFDPRLSSSKPIDKSVNEYLSHSGFYDYVYASGNSDEINSQIYDDSEIVKIKREKIKSEIQSREDAIVSILSKYSSLTREQIEYFDCTVLIEAFNNVTEHGHSYSFVEHNELMIEFGLSLQWIF